MIFAILDHSQIVTNIIVADQSFVDRAYPGAPRIDQLPVSPNIGWRYFKGVFTPPAN